LPDKKFYSSKNPDPFGSGFFLLIRSGIEQTGAESYFDVPED
jgi:hypothetical protein